MYYGDGPAIDGARWQQQQRKQCLLSKTKRNNISSFLLFSKMWSCSCTPPATVDLTEALTHPHRREQQHFAAESLLREALSARGWCLVSIDTTQLNNDSPIKSIQPLQMKQQVEALFDAEFIASKNNGKNAPTYRGRMAESGSGQAEPKQSWEVKRCCAHEQQQDQNECYLDQWTRALHSVAVAVTRVLRLPPNLLLAEDDCQCAASSEERCNIDLLRVFYYDAVDTTTNGNSMGSSPHTDWGSFTVVWQDDVGGLQTYCQAHQQWVDVPAPPLKESRVFFVVHVGDVTSLAMGHATSRASSSSNQDSPRVIWPSPRHRVQSPKNSVPRASLVYFAYPPPGISLKDMEEVLVAEYSNNKRDESPAVQVPYVEYFLLHNQSVNGAAQSPEETYSVMRLRPLDGVFDDKWRQVQR